MRAAATRPRVESRSPQRLGLEPEDAGSPSRSLGDWPHQNNGCVLNVSACGCVRLFPLQERPCGSILNVHES